MEVFRITRAHSFNILGTFIMGWLLEMIKPGQEMMSLLRKFSLAIIEPNFKYVWCLDLVLIYDFCHSSNLQWQKSIQQDPGFEVIYSLVLFSKPSI